MRLTICYNSYSPTYYYGIKRKYWTNWIGFYPNLPETRVTQAEIESRRKPVLTGIRERERKSLENHSNGTDALRQLLLGQKYGGRISR